jgi:predicted ATPase
LQNKSLLLLLDSFEQVILAAPLVAELLVACVELKVLAASRESLRISGEREYPVPPLALPDLTQLPSLELHVCRGQLFINAQAVSGRRIRTIRRR